MLQISFRRITAIIFDPQAYITDVAERIAGNWPASRWDELKRWNWQPPELRLAQAA